MSTRFESTVVVCGANRAQTNALQIPLGWAGGIVQTIRIVIPAGHAGLTGIALGYGGNATVPLGTDAFYFGDDREIILNYDDQVPGVSWAAFVFNTDSLQHSWEVDMDLIEIGVTNATTSIAPLSPDAIIAAGLQAGNAP